MPAVDIELYFRRPDEIAVLSEAELEARCQHNDDICILDSARFFVRCTIPLPVHECAEPYAIGAWAEISEPDFQKVMDLWDDENQRNQPPIDAVLANNVPLTSGSFGCKLAVKLTGPSTRPHIIIADEKCSLFHEQSNGISIHRASEYSDLLRSDSNDNATLELVEEQELEVSQCSCCKREIRTFCGYITDPGDGNVRADYWLRIPQGHKGLFTVAVAIKDGGKPRVAVLLGEATSEGFTYWIQDRKDSPWEHFGEYGAVLDREEVLNDSAKDLYFIMVDKIAASDSRLIKHTAPYLNAE